MTRNTEKSKSVAQNRPPREAAILKQVNELCRVLARQGGIVASWRSYRGQQIGPYYRLVYRADGRQRSIYLGRSGSLVERVRAIVRRCRQPLAERRQVAQLRQLARRAFRAHKKVWARQLARTGQYLKGNEIRGLRNLTLPKIGRIRMPGLATKKRGRAPPLETLPLQ
jgi:hypothetical protein